MKTEILLTSWAFENNLYSMKYLIICTNSLTIIKLIIINVTPEYSGYQKFFFCVPFGKTRGLIVLEICYIRNCCEVQGNLRKRLLYSY